MSPTARKDTQGMQHFGAPARRSRPPSPSPPERGWLRARGLRVGPGPRPGFRVVARRAGASSLASRCRGSARGSSRGRSALDGAGRRRRRGGRARRPRRPARSGRGSGTTSRRRPLRGRPGPCARAGGGRRRKWAARWCGRGPGRWLRRPGRRCGRSPSAWQGSWSEREISQRKRAGAQYARFVVVCYNKIRSSRFLWDGIPNHWTGPEQTGVVFNSKAAWLRS